MAGGLAAETDEAHDLVVGHAIVHKFLIDGAIILLELCRPEEEERGRGRVQKDKR
jgi:hypothetical protein